MFAVEENPLVRLGGPNVGETTFVGAGSRASSRIRAAD